jgi:ribosomal protein S18 acetylase RimI-like enzyme
MSGLEPVSVREARLQEHAAAGRLLVDVYAALPGFPGPDEQPAYYAMLADVGELAARPGTRLLVAAAPDGSLAGVVVYVGDLAHYGSAASLASRQEGAGIRLLAVDPAQRGAGLGRRLTVACIERARAEGKREVLLHTTRAMPAAWALYERMGFVRDTALDFDQQGLPVSGFRLLL